MTWAARFTPARGEKAGVQMIASPREIWVYLAASPLLNLTMTLAAYLVGDYLFRKSGQKAIFNPVLIAIVILVEHLAGHRHLV